MTQYKHFPTPKTCPLSPLILGRKNREDTSVLLHVPLGFLLKYTTGVSQELTVGCVIWHAHTLNKTQ
jgi:hypothetical protein